MMYLRRSVAAAMMSLFVLLAVPGMASVRTATIPRVAKGPVLKGDMSDPLWAKGALLSGFHSLSEKSAITQETKARVLYDSQNIYLGIRCAESSPKSMSATTKDHDGPVWQDDCIELLFDTANGHHAVYHIIVNSLGTVYDEKCMDVERAIEEWSSTCRIKTGRVSGAWIIEIAIPFKDFGITLQQGLTWGLNVCRARYAGTKEYSAWSPTPGGFVQPQNLGHIVFGDSSGKWNGIRVASWGNLDSDTSFGGRNVVECVLPNMGRTSAIYDIALTGGKNDVRRRVSIAPGETVPVDLAYTSSGSLKESYKLKLSSKGKDIFVSTHPSMSIPRTPRVWNVKDPLFKELLSETPAGDQKNGAIYWFHSGVDSQLDPFAKEYGVRFSLDEAYKELGEAPFMPIMQTGSLKGDLLPRMEAKYPFKVLFQPDYRGSRDKGAPQIDGLPFALDPRSREAYFNDLAEGIRLGRDYIWAVYTQDELHEKTYVLGVKFFAQMKDTYPFIREVDEMVKREFGFGKYGIPLSEKDDNPYRWIAYHKWVNSQLVQWQKETYELTKKLAPELKVISIDPVAGHNPVQFDAITPYVDIATHQLYPSANPNRQEFGFVTKFVADLTGKPTWTCAHVENYAYSVTAEETRELMSQIMRNGGKGFHLYIPDVRGKGADKGDTLLTKYGCPERYRAIKEILHTTSTMNEVAMPEDPDSAIFYSEDYFQSWPSRDYTMPNYPEFAYTFLGPVARTWFKIVNDNMVIDGRENLSRYKVVVIPAAKYQRPTAVDAVLKYVSDGGTVVCADPETFTLTTDGTPLDEVHAKLFGATSVAGVKHSTLTFSPTCSLPHLRGVKLSVLTKPWDLELAPGVEVLAKFEDGSPAIIRNPVGKGSVILFAVNPFSGNAVADTGWKSAFKSLAADLGLKTGRDIWRFKFPEFKTVYQPDPTGVCLTGNFVKWHQERPLDICNTNTTGKYSYSLAPDGIADRDNLAFGEGKLTDRAKAPTTPKSKLKPEDFIVTWKSEKPVDITFDFADAYAMNKAHLWYSGQLPAITIEGSTDSRTWTRLASGPKQSPTQDVLDLVLNWKPSREFRFIRMSFGERLPGQPMTLAECEVWAE